MNIKKIQPALVIIITFLFSMAFLFLREYWIALFALAIGVSWLLVEKYKIEFLFNLYFTGFIWLAARGCISDLPIPLMLLGVCVNLAAWDLSRFLARIRQCQMQDPEPGLVKKHMRKLIITLCVGYILALLPITVRLSMNFMLVIVISLLIFFTLRQSLVSLRGEKGSK